LSVRGFLKRPEAVILLCFVVAAPFLLTFWVNGDGIGYAAYLRSAVVDRDLKLSDEFAHLTSHIEAEATGLPSKFLRQSSHRVGIDSVWHSPRPDPVTGRVPSYFSVGPAIAWAPAYVAAHGLTLLAAAAGAPLRPDGYGGLYYLAIILSSFAFGLAGLLLAFRIAGIAAPPREAMWSVLAIGWATPAVYYLYLSASYGQPLTMFTSAVFLLYWWRTRHADRPTIWFIWGLLAGVLFLVRWNDLVLAVPAFAVEAFRLLTRRGARSGRSGVWQLLACAGAAFAGFLLVAAPQLAVWQYFHGRPWVRHPTDYVQLDPWASWKMLVSARHGLFVWTPVAVPAVAGLFLLFRRNRELAGVSLAAVILLILSNSIVEDWWGRSSFGLRRLVSGTPFLVLGLAVFYADARLLLGRWGVRGPDSPGRARLVAGRLAAPVFSIAFAGWNLLLVAQYALGMISHTEAVSFAAMAANQPKVLARLIQLVAQALR
jgi:hypothetical protein